jgi:hypothetical protein
VENEEMPAEESGLEATVADLYAMPDQVLAGIVEAANQVEGTKIGITLYVSGQIITGVLIPAADFFQQLSDQINTADEGAGAGEGAARTMMTISGVYRMRGRLPGEPGDEEGNPAVTLYIHLEDAAVVHPETGRDKPVGLWRGRLSHVSGWSVRPA